MDTSAPEAYQGGEGPPLVLLHGLNMSWRAWAPVLPLLSERFRVYAPTLPGHRGGPALRTDGQAGVEELTWMVREQLAAAGITAAHLVGNSLGGAVALMLAEAGAARSVTAFSPAGGWRGRREFHRLALLLRAGRLAMGLPWAGGMLAFPALRAVLLRAMMNRPGELGRDEFAELTADLRGCTILQPLLDEARRSGPMKPALTAAIPVRVAWPDRDRMIGFSSYGAPLLEHLPQAEVVRLAGVGHVPMYDDPALVATVITEFVDAAEQTSSARPTTVPSDTNAETGGLRA